MNRGNTRRGLSTMGFLKLAASALVLGSTMVGCTMDANGSHAASVSAVKAERIAAAAAARASKAMGKRDYVKAIGLAETAVAAQPRNAAYRMLLGQAYLGAGRFQSAETSFSDTLTLDPERERAALNLALTQIALGKQAAAKSTLADYRDKLAAADFGLAMALAGDPDEAVRVLEFASRAPDANAKTRQNLALAYALQGKWANAKVMAVQDLTPDAADARIAEWAGFARPGGSSEQVVALLGVKRATDAGQPTRLALNAAPTAVQTAMVEAPQPVAVAEPAPPPMAAPEAPAPQAPVAEAAAPAFETPVAAPVRPVAYVAPKPVAAPRAAPIIRADARPIKQAVVAPVRFVPARVSPMLRPANFVKPVAGGKFVVQLGAFSNAAIAERAWGKVSGKIDLAGYDAVNGAVKHGNLSLIRLSVGGFGSHDDASAVCARIKQTGNSCFVRVQSGDAPARWVQKHTYRVASR